MFNDSILEAFQLAVLGGCLTFLFITLLSSLIYSFKTRRCVFRSESILSVNILLFVLLGAFFFFPDIFEVIIQKDITFKIYQSAKLLLLFTLPLFFLYFINLKRDGKKLVKILMWFGLSVSLFFIVFIYLFPDLLYSALFFFGLDKFMSNLVVFIEKSGAIKIANILLMAYLAIFLIITIIGFSGKKHNKLIIFGILFAIIGITDDLQKLYTDSFWFLPEIVIDRFVFHLTIMMLFFVIAIFKNFFYIRLNPEVTELNYENIIQASDEMAFVLSPQLDILTANEKAKKVFKTKGKNINFIDCLYLQEIEEGKDRLFWKERLIKLKRDGDKLSFNTYIKNNLTSMPDEYHFRFDCFSEGKFHKLIGRAWPTVQSEVTNFIDTEQLCLIIDNNVALVDSITEKLTTTLKQNLERKELLLLRLGLYEMIINAIEHGNLGITADKKTRAEELGYLFELLNDKRKEQKYRDKKVIIDYHYDQEKVIYRITDMGSGFNYEHTIDLIKNNSYQEKDSRCSGILMALSVFDSVDYNDAGNQVLLTKKY